MTERNYISDEASSDLEVFLKSQQFGIRDTLGKLLGQGIDLKSEMPFIASLDDLTEMVGDIGVIVKLAFEGYPMASVFAIGDLPSVLTMGGVMSMYPDDLIAKKIVDKDLNEGDQAAFTEIVRSMLDNVNTALATGISDKLRLEVESDTKTEFIKGSEKVGDISSESDYLVLRYSFTPRNNPESGFYLVFQRKGTEKLFRTDLEPVDLEPLAIAVGNLITAVVFDTSKADGDHIKTILEAANIGVVVFRTMKGVMRAIRQEGIGLLILAITPHNWDSLSLVRYMRKTSQSAKVPVILIMSEPTKEMFYNAYKLGLHNIILKPVRRGELFNQIKRIDIPTASIPPSAPKA